LIAGPAVSLYGSPTVSPVTAAPAIGCNPVRALPSAETGVCLSVGQRGPARTGNPDAAFHSCVPASFPRRTAADPLAHGTQRRIVVARRGMGAAG
jgi:hypothetical protein